MDKSELLKDLKKIDLNLIKKSDVKMFKAERIAVEYYNDAVDNIIEGNTDIAIIKLKKVLSLSPDFSEASHLLTKISEFENSHSIGDKVYESMHGRDVNAKLKASGGLTLPQRLNINPRVLIKLIIVILVIVLTVILSIVIFKLFNSEPGTGPGEPEAVTYSQEEVNALNKRIEELEVSLAKSEVETQKALSSSTGSEDEIQRITDENKFLLSQLSLYKAKVLFERGEIELSADIAKSLNSDDYKGADKELYIEVYNKATFQAANYLYKTGLSLNSQKDYAGAVVYLEKVDDYAPDFNEIGNCYYVLAKAYYELGKAERSIELFKYIDSQIPDFENETGLLYYTGKAYQQLEQYENARTMYNQLIANFPNSTLVGYAKDRLKELP